MDGIKSRMDENGLGEVIDEVMPYGSIMAGDWKINAPWKVRKRKRQENKEKNKK